MLQPEPDAVADSSPSIDPITLAKDLLLKAEQQVATARAQYDRAQATYKSARALCDNLNVAAPRPSLLVPAKSSSFCEDCSKIPLDALFHAWPKIKPARRRVGDLFQAVERQSWCTFCKFLIEAFQLGDELHSERLALHLKARDSAIYFAVDPEGLPWYRRAALDIDRPTCPFFWLQTGMPTMTGMPHICITLSNPDGGDVGVRPRQRDALEAFNGSMSYELINQWLDRCTTQHTNECARPHKSTIAPFSIDLIDVHTRKIVRRPTTERYIALSYVWGKGNDLHLRTSGMREVDSEGSSKPVTPHPSRKRIQLPAEVPQTMEDAMIFTRRLGEQYLWVDLFCIDQHDPVQMRQQIDAMHNIFLRPT